MTEPGPVSDSSQLSKRAARRLIQRAFVLAGRDRNLRQHIREVRLATVWILEAWGLVWSVHLDRGELDFERRRAKQPDASFTWRTAEQFFEQIEKNSFDPEGFEYSGPPELRRTFEPLYRALSAALSEVLRNPVDENGDPLV